MLRLILSALLLLVLSDSGHADFKTVAENEARVLKSYRDRPNAPDLMILAFIREERGKYAESLQTWGLLRKTFGTSYSRAYTGNGDKIMTYNQLADWTANRINAKQRGIKQASAATRRAAQSNFEKYQATDKTANATLVDLNGDGLKEMVAYIDSGRKLRVHIWNGYWDSVWQSKDDAKISGDYLITGGEDKGWPQVYISYLREGSPNPEDGHLMTNGHSWIVVYN